MTNLEKYTAVFSDMFSVEPEALNEEFTFANVEAWDSMTHLSLITALEDTFDVMFDPEDILNYGGFMNGINILTKYGVDFQNA